MDPTLDRASHRQRCAVCHQVDPVMFWVPGPVWGQVVPVEFQQSIVCLRCFVSYADEMMVAWDEEIAFAPVSLATHLRAVTPMDRGMHVRPAPTEAEQDWKQVAEVMYDTIREGNAPDVAVRVYEQAAVSARTGGRQGGTPPAPSATDVPAERSSCAFCNIVADPSSGSDYREFANDVVVFRPLNPVTPGHMLVVPKVHAPNVGALPSVSAAAMYVASLLASQMDSCNVITSQGDAATQTIGHLHIHVVPRRFGDGLKLPWSAPTEASKACPHNLPRSDHVRIVQAENMLRRFCEDLERSPHLHNWELEQLAGDVKDWFDRKAADVTSAAQPDASGESPALCAESPEDPPVQPIPADAATYPGRVTRAIALKMYQMGWRLDYENANGRSAGEMHMLVEDVLAAAAVGNATGRRTALCEGDPCLRCGAAGSATAATSQTGPEHQIVVWVDAERDDVGIRYSPGVPILEGRVQPVMEAANRLLAEFKKFRAAVSQTGEPS